MAAARHHDQPLVLDVDDQRLVVEHQRIGRPSAAAGKAAATVSRKPRTCRETSRTEPDHLPPADQPAAYLTQTPRHLYTTDVPLPEYQEMVPFWKSL
ncbi:MAG: hypothetical protein M3083_08300 [Actinomycetota bacterium]|nr:hypothetical protein [Actinomycetota bacterium]MDQ6949883.1 hypothetical protein [Actinomycetota bacterium]